MSGPALSARRVSVKCTKKIFTRGMKHLEGRKKCIGEYVGTELSRKRGKTSRRADVFGMSKSNEGEKTIYLCEGNEQKANRNRTR